MKKAIRNFFNGLVFGAVQTVPSVSAGTIAIVMGFYFDLVKSINNFRKDMRGNAIFLAPVLLGACAGIVAFSAVISFLLERHALPTMLFFMGLILGVVPRVFAKAVELGGRLGAREMALALAPFPILLGLALLRMRLGASGDPAEALAAVGAARMLFLLFAGALAAVALVVPGMSGSFVLLLLGVYPEAIYAAQSLRHFLSGSGSPELFLSILKVLGPLGVGVIAGGLLTLRAIERLLERHGRPLYSAMAGLMAASVIALAMDPITRSGGASLTALTIGAAAFALGFAASNRLSKGRL
ncbi:MAG: DUF368 domain-containing protein [Treponema sp.]|nr:DUF368 domain-containing protein [Treponema sp.]